MLCLYIGVGVGGGGGDWRQRPLLVGNPPDRTTATAAAFIAQNSWF